MWPGSLNLELSPNVFKILKDLILERAGLNYDGKRELLVEKLSPLLQETGFSSFLDFYYLLKYGPNSESVWPRVIDSLSVQETYFWREMCQIHALVNEVLPKLVSGAPDKPLRIWSAACATGEEPLTIAMALTESDWFKRSQIRISASDISPAAITHARKGLYRERSFRALPADLREKYFTVETGGSRPIPELSARIDWHHANLMNASEFAELVNVPIIFCRNVFIYFSDETISHTVRLFAQRMQRPGYLFAGAAESLLRVADDFELQEIGGAFVYTVK